jgi:hypothetical protein
LANLAINAAPHSFVFSEDEQNLFMDDADNTFTPIHTPQPLTPQANARHQPPPPYGYHPPTPYQQLPLAQPIAHPQYLASAPVNYGNQWSPLTGYMAQQGLHRHQPPPPIAPMHVVMPPAQPNGSKHEILLSPKKLKKRGQGTGLGSHGG